MSHTHGKAHESLVHGDLCLDGFGRWCAAHEEVHGPSYMCEHWPHWVVEEIEDGNAKNRAVVVERLKAGDRSYLVMVCAVSLGLLPRSCLPPASVDDDRGCDGRNAPSMN